MRPCSDADLETIADQEDVALFIEALARVGVDYRRVLSLLIPRLAALEERGDIVGALELIKEVRAIVTSPEQPEQ